jgi:SWIM zinc finger
MVRAAAPEPRYTVKSGAGEVVKVTKWVGPQRVHVDFVEPERWWQKCSCPSFAFRRIACKHVKLLNLLTSGRLRPARWYEWDRQGAGWVAGAIVASDQPRRATSEA